MRRLPIKGKAKIVETGSVDTSFNVGNFAALSNAVHPHKLDADDHLQLCGQRVAFPKSTQLPGYPTPAFFPLSLSDAVCLPLHASLVARQERCLTVLRGESIPLDNAAAAHRAFEDRRTVGKVVLIP